MEQNILLISGGPLLAAITKQQLQIEIYKFLSFRASFWSIDFTIF